MQQLNRESVEIRPGRTLSIMHLTNPSTTKTLFFLHGLGGRAEQWAEEIDFFKGDYNVVAFDLLGHGNSSKPRDNAEQLYSFQEFANDAQAILLRYGNADNSVIGHSFGGALAAYLTLHNPDKINRMVLVNPLVLEPNITIAKAFDLPIWVLELIRPLLTHNFMKLAFNPTTDKKIIDKEIECSRKNPMYVIKAMMQGAKSLPKENLARLKQPVLIILVPNDKLLPAELTRQIYGPLPNAQYEEITSDVGHMVILEQPQQVNQLIKKFLEEHIS